MLLDIYHVKNLTQWSGATCHSWKKPIVPAAAASAIRTQIMLLATFCGFFFFLQNPKHGSIIFPTVSQLKAKLVLQMVAACHKSWWDITTCFNGFSFTVFKWWISDFFCCNAPFWKHGASYLLGELHIVRKGNAARCVSCPAAYSSLTMCMVFEDDVARGVSDYVPTKWRRSKRQGNIWTQLLLVSTA